MTHLDHDDASRRLVFGALLLAAGSFALSQTMVAPALHAIQEAYGATPSSSSWVLTGYLLSASVCTPIVGKLGDVYGKGRVLTIVLVVFALGGVVCALSSTIGVLIGGRVLQGVAGGVFPLAFGIVRDTFPPERVAPAIGTISAMFGIGSGVGLPLSGVIVDHLDLSLLFWAALAALPAAYASWRLVPPSPAHERTRIDWAGAAGLSIALVAVLLGITKANAWGWGAPRTLALLLGGTAVLALWTRFEARHPAPLVHVGVLCRRPVLATNVAAFLTGVAMFASFLLVPQFVQAGEDTGYGFGVTVTQAGLIMVPSSVAMLFAGPLAGTLGNRIGSRLVLVIGSLATAASFGMLLVARDEVWQIGASSAVLGLGVAFAYAAMANLVVTSVDASETGVAIGINTIMRTVGGSFGAAAGAALLTSQTIGTSSVPSESGFLIAFAIALVAALLAAGAALAIPAERLRGGQPGRAAGSGAGTAEADHLAGPGASSSATAPAATAATIASK